MITQRKLTDVIRMMNLLQSDMANAQEEEAPIAMQSVPIGGKKMKFVTNCDAI